MNTQLLFSILSAAITIGGVCVAFGVIKGKVSQALDVNEEQSKKIDNCASKNDLAAAIKRSDEMLDMMRKRAEEDRANGEGHYRELYGILSNHGERIKALEMTQQAIDKTLEEIKGDVKTGFADIKVELKELRKQG